MVVLAEILDLTDADLEVHLANLLGVSAKDAADVHRRIRRHHAFAAAFAAALGSIALVGAPNVSASPRPATAVVVSSVHEEVPVTTATVASTPTAASDDGTTPPPPPAPTSHTSPSSPDDVQIGDALVIERGDQPADPSTQIGDAVTYER